MKRHMLIYLLYPIGELVKRENKFGLEFHMECLSYLSSWLLYYCILYLFLVFFLANFCNLETKKKGWLIQQKDFWNFKKQINHILTK
jgi:hypothetical protein